MKVAELLEAIQPEHLPDLYYRIRMSAEYYDMLELGYKDVTTPEEEAEGKVIRFKLNGKVKEFEIRSPRYREREFHDTADHAHYVVRAMHEFLSHQDRKRYVENMKVRFAGLTKIFSSYSHEITVDTYGHNTININVSLYDVPLQKNIKKYLGPVKSVLAANSLEAGAHGAEPIGNPGIAFSKPVRRDEFNVSSIHPDFGTEKKKLEPIQIRLPAIIKQLIDEGKIPQDFFTSLKPEKADNFGGYSLPVNPKYASTKKVLKTFGEARKLVNAWMKDNKISDITVKVTSGNRGESDSALIHRSGFNIEVKMK